MSVRRNVLDEMSVDEMSVDEVSVYPFSEGKLKLRQCRTELFKQTFYNRIPHLWNNLPKFLRLSNLNPSSFTKHCNEFYKSKTKDFIPNKPSVTWDR